MQHRWQHITVAQEKHSRQTSMLLKGQPILMNFCKIVVEEATAEGVRAEVLFAQMLLRNRIFTVWWRCAGNTV